MFEWNYFYGVLMLDMDYAKNETRNHKDAIKFIQNDLITKNYFYFHPAIFSIGTEEKPYCYDNVFITFGRSAKCFLRDASELNNFIFEFEDILKNLDFETAQIKIGGIYGDNTLFWLNRKKLLNEKGSSLETTLSYFSENKIRYYENDLFYFGFGEINISTGWCEKKYDVEELELFDKIYPDFEYPIKKNIA